MQWTQTFDPFSSPAFSALIATVPLLVLFVFLAAGRVKGWIAALCSAGVSLAIAVAFWRMPAAGALSAALFGSAFALFPIIWILIAALWIYHLSVDSGQFERIKAMLGGMTNDRRLQALFIAFAFGSFLEGTAGFGVPVAITSAMLVGLGFDPILAATLCLLANSSPVAFAAAGVPITVAAQASGLDPLEIGSFVALQLPLLSLFMPLWLSVFLCGWKRSLEILPAILVGGLCLALTQLIVSMTLGPWSTGVVSGLATVAGLGILMRFWKPKRSWDFGDRIAAPTERRADFTFAEALRAWSPYLLTSIFVLLWSTPFIKNLLKPTAFRLAWPLLPGPVFLDLSVLSSSGTAIFAAGLLSVFILPDLGPRKALAALGKTIGDLRFTIPTVCLVMANASVMNHSGMSTSIALLLAGTGPLFPLFAPLLGWIGVVLTGSDTSSNALFCSLQRTTADRLGLNPSLMVAANTSGGVAGKMISPQSLSVATASSGLAGREGTLFRAAFPHSIAMALMISLINLGLSFLF
ncbi:MAG TPA: lactate permease [Treponema sp.]|nr:MAG: lactate permease [Treponema sp. GWA1_62_8]OHE69866.1 MAG: lactate permease [Treponema sp. GWC1_61_84]HCM29082.1 lactate permease [Treponema sp.]